MTTQPSAYSNGFEQLADELNKLDLIIKRQVYFFRQTLLQPPHISREVIDQLLSPAEEQAAEHPIDRQIEALEQLIQARVAQSFQQGIHLPLAQLAQSANLSSFERQALVICLAPELQRKYDKLYAYLQDDITRKQPSIELILTLLCRSEQARWQMRPVLGESGLLRHTGLLQAREEYLKVDERLLYFVLGRQVIDHRVRPWLTYHTPQETLETLIIEPAVKQQLITTFEHLKPPAIIHFYGPSGVGKRNLALALCQKLGCPLLQLDLENPLDEESLQLVFRELLLLQAMLYLYPTEALTTVKPLIRFIREYGGLILAAGSQPWQLEQMPVENIAVPLPDAQLRELLWRHYLPHLETADLAQQFQLTPEQIQTIAQTSPTTTAQLYSACRQISNQKLRELALFIEPRYGWSDLVLAESKQAMLREISSQARQQHKVFTEWGFAQKIAYGKGISALFSGHSGTGKTMAAQVIAHDLHLGLYKIDLSTVVSKYVGETEKNLARIFQEAQTSNALLFFDEADALFGKRTKIADAHDRYANIEVSYLLQKMEEYEGLVILASNLRENMDDAFVRRIRFIVEFPFPEVEDRLMIWKKHFPATAPVSDEIDYSFLAQQFTIAGGHIKNAVLHAAFFAAAEDQVIGMAHILRGVRREFEKMGRLWDERRFVRLGG